jgi:SAM-dependent methyltransferase
LPFSEGEFDRVTCRFGLMFFPDTAKSLAEIRRVLKPGGRVCFAVWGSFEENPFFGVSMKPFMKRVKMPPPAPDAPHIFRFADEIKLAKALSSAGFREVNTSKHQIIFSWPGSAEECWEAASELAAPFKKLIAALPPDQTEEVIGEILDGLRRFESGGNINLPGTVIVVVGSI